MKRYRLSFPSGLLSQTALAVLTVAATTVILLLIGRDALVDAVIPLLYLIPVGWSASRWGQGPGLCAAVSAALMFDYYFVPPFHTFTVGNLEGWLVLAIFAFVAVVLVGRIQSSLSKAQASERDAIFMYELSAALADVRRQDPVLDVVARHLQTLLQAAVVTVVVYPGRQRSIGEINEPADAALTEKPDRVIPIQGAQSLLGEIQIWRGHGWLPPEGSRLLQNLATQAASALERTRPAEAERQMIELPVSTTQ